MSAVRLRLMPVVMTAAGALLALKLAGLATHTSFLFVPQAHASDAKPEVATPALPNDHGFKEQANKPAGAQPGTKPAPASEPVEQPLLAETPSSERALMEALSRRREALDSRVADIDMRENLLKAAEKRLEDRLAELKRLEVTVGEADKKRSDEEKARFKDLVTMYEGMKVKEAARIFDKLEPGVLLSVASMMNPRKLSDILGQMSPDSAQTLTVALARREVGVPSPTTVANSDLPKIEARPSSQ